MLEGTKVFMGLPSLGAMTMLVNRSEVTQRKLIIRNASSRPVTAGVGIQRRDLTFSVHQPCSADQNSSFAKVHAEWARKAASAAEKKEDYPS